MLVISVVVAVSIRITKAKLDSIVSYTYYSAYSTLSSVARNMVANYNPKDNIYSGDFTFAFQFPNNILLGSVFPQAKAADENRRKIKVYSCPLDLILVKLYKTPEPDTPPDQEGAYGYSYYEFCQLRYLRLSGDIKVNEEDMPISIDKPLDYAACTSYPDYTTINGEKYLECPGVHRPMCDAPSLHYGHFEPGCEVEMKTYDKASDYQCNTQCVALSGHTSGEYSQITGQKNCGRYSVQFNATFPWRRGYMNWDLVDEKPSGNSANLLEGTWRRGICLNHANPFTQYGHDPKDYGFNSVQKIGSSEDVYDRKMLNTYGYCLTEYYVEDIPEPTCDKTPPSNIPCGKRWNGSPEVCALEDIPGFSRNCPSGEVFDEASCSCAPKTCDLTPPSDIPCGKQWNSSPDVCALEDVPGFSRNCPDTEEFNEDSCSCIPKVPKVPVKGVNFCELFETYANIKSNTSICQGSSISTTTTDFSGKTPDLILRNGIRLFNMSQDPTFIDELRPARGLGAGWTGMYSEEGYTVYVDIDGVKGESKLWEDVFPFYITLSGKVIPLYDKSSDSAGRGGDDTRYLQTSVERTTIDALGKRKVYYPFKSVSFKEGACRSGYIDSSTPYCNGSYLYSGCIPSGNFKCKLKKIVPIKFF